MSTLTVNSGPIEYGEAGSGHHPLALVHAGNVDWRPSASDER